MSEPIQFLSPTETSRRLGVSVRALRIYERHGLVKPQRTAAGWRVYGPDQLTRLHQVLALKGLGLPLARIAELLSGRTASLDAILAFQEAALGRRRDEMERALQAIRSARARLARDQTLSLDDLTNLTRETQMSEPMSPEDWRASFEPLWRKHLSPDEYEKLKSSKVESLKALGLDPTTLGPAWDVLIAEANALMAARDYESPKALDVLARWRRLAAVATDDDPALNAKAAEIWREAVSDPRLEPKLVVRKELWEFMSEVSRRAKAA